MRLALVLIAALALLALLLHERAPPPPRPGTADAGEEADAAPASPDLLPPVEDPVLAGRPDTARDDGRPSGPSSPASAGRRSRRQDGVILVVGEARRLDTDRPLARSTLTLHLRHTGGGASGRVSRWRQRLTTDDEGRFRDRLDVGADEEIALDGVDVKASADPVGWWKRVGEAYVKDIEARAGETLDLRVFTSGTLSRTGIVVDDTGAPLTGVSINYTTPGRPAEGFRYWSWHQSVTSATGAFRITGILAAPAALLDGPRARHARHVSFVKEGYVPRRLDARDAPEGDDRPWQVVLRRGWSIRGRLVDEVGGPLPDVTVEAVAEDPLLRRTAVTDAQGRFRLDTIGSGRFHVQALVLARDLEARRPLTVRGPVHELDLVARPTDLRHPWKPVHVMGLKVVDVTPEVREAYELPEAVKVAVFDPGPNSLRLGVGLRKGCGIWIVGEREIESVRDFVTTLLACATAKEGATPRLVHTHATGTSTGRLHLGPDDLDALRRARDALR